MTIQEIKNTIEEGNSLKEIAQAYGEIALIRIKKIRAGVEQNRLFFNEISQIFRIVKHYAALKKISLKKTKRTVSILLTSNYRFFGNIDNSVIRNFIEITPKFTTDRIVIGRTGDDYLKTMNYFNTYQKLQFEKDLPNPRELQQLTLAVKDYTQVLVFYPQLVTIFIQNPTTTDITQSSIISSQTNTGLMQSQYMIFEPELPKIIEFFDTSIISMLIEQTFFEAELARTASRILAMDEAQINANKFIDAQRSLQAYSERSIQNTRILENFATFMALRKEG